MKLIELGTVLEETREPNNTRFEDDPLFFE